MKLIDADTLKKTIAAAESEKLNRMDHPPIIECMMTIKEVFDFIDKEPTVDPVKHGHWRYINYTWHCSECGKLIATPGYMPRESELIKNHKYCSHCGVKMENL